MNNENQARRGQQADQPDANEWAPRARKGKGKEKNRIAEMSRIKTLIAGLSVAATVGGWGMIAQHDVASSAQASADPITVVASVSQTDMQPTPEATATLQSAQATERSDATTQATDTPQATATATLTSSLQVLATATPQATAIAIATVAAAEASATPQATATPKPTSTPRAAVAVTRSSK